MISHLLFRLPVWSDLLCPALQMARAARAKNREKRSGHAPEREPFSVRRFCA
ncbi:Hypothetical predicted protein [Xyrichtys novacula]|uniref:Uncharacterized protein n=1 Tax=Xyrichtys novacula TaxID=13765 RepID=A0AAV1F9U0_XYRNO|nr:Hypothetical predicted protein [Xyrichtys novacula]